MPHAEINALTDRPSLEERLTSAIAVLEAERRHLLRDQRVYRTTLALENRIRLQLLLAVGLAVLVTVRISVANPQVPVAVEIAWSGEASRIPPTVQPTVSASNSGKSSLVSDEQYSAVRQVKALRP